jgi:RHS repeat-associated protein
VITRTAQFTYYAATCALQTEKTVGDTPQQSLLKTYYYDDFGNRYKEVASDGNGAGGRVTGAMLSDGSSSYTSTYGQYPTQARNAMGHAEYYSWYGQFGVKYQTTGPNGQTSQTTLDTFGRVLREQPNVSIPAYTDYTYAWCSTSLSCNDGRGVYGVGATSSDGALSYTTYDRLGREIRTRKRSFDGSFVNAVKYFDPIGRAFLTTDPFSDGQNACYAQKKFDQVGRVIQIWESYGTNECDGYKDFSVTPTSGGKITTFVYDIIPADGQGANGVAVKTTSAGRTSWKFTNVMGRTRFVRDDLGGAGCPSGATAMASKSSTCLQTEYDYDPQGNLTYTKQAGTLGASTSATLETKVWFNTRGFKTSMQDPDMGTWNYTSYSAFGELLSQTDAKNQTISMGYDALGRMTSRTDGSEGTTAWYYDTSAYGVGKIGYVTAPNGYREDYVYDDKGRVSQVKRTMDGAYYYVDQTYDTLGRADVLKYPGSFAGDGSGGPEADANRLRVRNNYNAYGYLMSVQDVANGTIYWQADTVDESGHVTEERLGNGLYTQRIFDRPTGYLRNIKTGTTAGGTSIQDLSMDYDQAANLTVRKDLAPGVNGGGGLREEFGYDALYRLTSTIRYTTGTGGVVSGSESYAYDDFGNLKVKGTSYSSYTYVASRPHGVQTVATVSGTRTYSYDANGSVQTVTGGANVYSAVDWTAANLTKRVWKGSQYTDFTYGPDRSRYKQYVYRSGTNYDTTHYVGGLVEKVTKVSGGSTTVDYSHYVRAGDSVITIVKRQKDATGTVGAMYPRYPHRDHLGSVVALTDPAGSLLERSAFDPWGKRRDYSSWAPTLPGTFVPGGSGSGGATNAVVSTTRGYTGHEQVEEFGFVHMNGRIYDPEIGKFFSADPTMQFPESTQGFNRYAYAGNDPLTNVDPSGFNVFKSIMRGLGWIGTIVSFIYPPAKLLTQMLYAAVNGFLVTEGNVRGAFAAFFTAGLGAQFAQGLGSLSRLGQFAPAIAGGILAGTVMAIAQGANFGAAILSSAIGSLRGYLQNVALGGIVGACASETDTPAVQGIDRAAASKSTNGAAGQAMQDVVVTGAGAGSSSYTPVEPVFYDQNGVAKNIFTSLGDALQAGEDAATLARIASGTQNEFGVATILGPVYNGIQTYFNSDPVTSNDPNMIGWKNLNKIRDKLVALNHWHPNDLGFSDDDQRTYMRIAKAAKNFAGVFMFDAKGNHMYGPRSPGLFGTRTHSCGGASANSWSCPIPAAGWAR